MRRPVVQWVLAVLITLGSAVWQRATGPTYPVRGTVTLDGQALALRLERSHTISARQPVVVRAADTEVNGVVEWRRFPTREPWRTESMTRTGDMLQAVLPPSPLPLMPPAGKLEYRVRLSHGAEQVVFPERPAVTRFKGDVTPHVLVPHIAAMFFGMLLSTRAGLAALLGGNTRVFGMAAVSLLVIGGFILGPIVQKAAFGAYWTGIPWGWDLTDNKTLISGAAWLAAVWQFRHNRQARAAVLTAAMLTLLVFAIPHSVWGSEVKWSR